mmetsp:Transcript_18324/g.22727  ORF Transcript_18324/g.22727 Transcript_18324/m.22727 type:complete len:139 (-) Transcript_18324:313-729(-)
MVSSSSSAAAFVLSKWKFVIAVALVFGFIPWAACIKCEGASNTHDAEIFAVNENGTNNRGPGRVLDYLESYDTNGDEVDEDAAGPLKMANRKNRRNTKKDRRTKLLSMDRSSRRNMRSKRKKVEMMMMSPKRRTAKKK